MRKHCIACNYHITYPIFQPEDQPLAFVHLPHDQLESLNVPLFPMNYRACAYCGHIFNIEFEYFKVPYEENSTQMYNRSKIWQDYMVQLADQILGLCPGGSKTLIDIGCGDGAFLELLRTRDPSCRLVGFEPGIEAESARKIGLEVYKDYFLPERDLKKFSPDFLICRHVIEHLSNPREFVSDIAYWSNRYEAYPYFIAEVPRIDKAIKHCRINDYLYEHVSNFTDFSFRNMFEISGYEAEEIRAEYDDEVLVGIVKPRDMKRMGDVRKSSEKYHASLSTQLDRVHLVLREYLRKGKKIAFWGGAGKGASFLNCLGIHHSQHPIVVDSDPAKVGRFVPGMGQEILSPEVLIHKPVDVIVITTQWRARDITLEIQDRGIKSDEILVLLNQELRPYDGSPILE